MEFSITTLKETCTMYQPETLSKKEMKQNGKYPVYGANGIIGYYDKFNHEKPQLLLGCRGSCGEVNISKPKSWISSNAMVIQSNSKYLNLEYIELFLKYVVDYKKIITGSATPQITRDILEKVKLYYPNLEEQNKIISNTKKKFSEIDELINKYSTIKKNINNIFKSSLVDSFTFKDKNFTKKNLKEISEDYGRGKSKHRPRKDPRLFGDKIPFIQTGNIRKAKIYVESYDKSYNEFGIKQSRIWKKGTVCITIAANIAEIGILKFDACFPDSIIGVYPNKNKASSEYIFFLLKYFQTYIRSKSEGSAQQNINLATFENEKFPILNNLNEQDELVNKLKKIQSNTNEFEKIIDKKIDNLHILKSSIVKKKINFSNYE